ncbi:unnamed protein product [Haemonchus placei]|uniref:Venom protein n=1 Tax=Haemonchus placei TaxID=6290 RepID=A0A0N4WV28_HAEPC|nr:unnamed protein product [Haemonchus contortus]VDO56966.1 unnamed protein product [Haemonchus placei]
MSTIVLLVILSVIGSVVESKLSAHEQCVRLKHLYSQIPSAIALVTDELCASPAATMQCVLMGKLSLEYSRERVMELRFKSDCLPSDSTELATTEELCAILDSLPAQSVKLATKIFSKTPEKQLAQRFGATVTKALYVLTNKIYMELSCDKAI